LEKIVSGGVGMAEGNNTPTIYYTLVVSPNPYPTNHSSSSGSS